MLRHIPSVTNLVVNCLQGEVQCIEQIGQLKHLVSLKIGVESLQSIAFLELLPPILEVLYLEEAKSKNLNLSDSAGLVAFGGFTWRGIRKKSTWSVNSAV